MIIFEILTEVNYSYSLTFIKVLCFCVLCLLCYLFILFFVYDSKHSLGKLYLLQYYIVNF